MGATKAPAPPRWGIPAPYDTRPLRVAGMKENGKPFEPKPRAVGSELTFNYNGQIITGPVWSAAADRGAVWVVVDQVAYLVHAAGWVMRMFDYRRAEMAS